MKKKILLNDLKRNKMVNTAQFLFMILPAFLLASGASMVCQMFSAIDTLFELSAVPHFVQMHGGDLDRTALVEWSLSHDFLVDSQIVRMLNIDGSSVYLKEDRVSLADTVMDLGFVTQNRRFDFLLDQDNRPVSPAPGEIGVPLYFADKFGLALGETLLIEEDHLARSFEITSFVRDPQMNPSLVHSKRFVLNEEDFAFLDGRTGEEEYLIEFRLNDLDRLSQFAQEYADSGLPSKGPAVTISLFRILNAVSDGLTAFIIIFISLMLCLVTVLCLRFSLLTSLEEDKREIGVMKAIGFPRREIGKIYRMKYYYMAGTAVIMGWLLSLSAGKIFTRSVLFYMGRPSPSVLSLLLPPAAASLVFLAVYISCRVLFKRFDRMTVVFALRPVERRAGRGIAGLSLDRNPLGDLNAFLGLRDIILRFPRFSVLWLVFIMSSFIVLVPLNFYNTVNSARFIGYLGMGKSHIRIDLVPEEGQEIGELADRIEGDPRVAQYSLFSSSRFRFLNEDGIGQSLTVESGDYSRFPLEFLEGRAPEGKDEIALSLLNAQDTGLAVGDLMRLYDGDSPVEMRVSGIYQDVTNGGYSAKSPLPPRDETLLRHVIALDLKEDSAGSREGFVRDYAAQYPRARVTDTEHYIKNTLGDTIHLLKVIARSALFAGILICLLITSLFYRMILAGDSARSSVLLVLGFSPDHIRRQYFSGALVILITGIILGTWGANRLGESLMGALWAVMGASKIRFVIHPLQSYVLIPLAMVLAVSVTLYIITGTLNNRSISELNGE